MSSGLCDVSFGVGLFELFLLGGLTSCGVGIIQVSCCLVGFWVGP